MLKEYQYDKPSCPFCGEDIYIFVEPICGQHPNEKWFVVNHACDDSDISVEMLQKGGSIDTVLKALNRRCN